MSLFQKLRCFRVSPQTWNSPLQVLLAATTVILILIVSAALITLGFSRARDAAVRDAETSMAQFSARLVERFDALSEPVTAALGLMTAVPNALLTPPPARQEDKTRLMREVIRQAPHLDGIYVGYPDGAFFHVVNLATPGWREALGSPEAAMTAFRMIEETGYPRLVNVTFVDADGTVLGEATPVETAYDPRNRPWYGGAARQRAPIATPPYRMSATGRIGVTIAQSHAMNPDVVLGADLILTSVAEFLASERLTPNAVAFVVDAAGRPVIHSEAQVMARLLSRNGQDDGETGDPVLDAFAASTGLDGSIRFLTAEGQRYVTRDTPLGANLLLAGHRAVVAAPLRELTEDARRSMMQALSLAAAVVVVAVAVALFIARWITRSLHRLTDGADRLRSLDFTTPIVVGSRIREIGTLERAMNGARDAIQSFALYVPKEFVRRGLEAGHFADREAARSEVTAVFTDIYDFTTISEALPPEQVVALLSEYFDILDEVVRAHGGEIIQFLGDSIFALWNAPVPDPDHAANACRAALAGEARLAAFNAAQRAAGQPELRTRWGIHTGAAVVGSVGARARLQYTGMGDTINVASRLEGMNKLHGTAILASGDVVARCAGQIRFRPLGVAQAKGRAEALAIHEVLGLSDV